MRVKLQVKKDKKSWYEGVYDVVDAASFGDACADAWTKLREQNFRQQPALAPSTIPLMSI